MSHQPRNCLRFLHVVFVLAFSKWWTWNAQLMLQVLLRIGRREEICKWKENKMGRGGVAVGFDLVNWFISHKSFEMTVIRMLTAKHFSACSAFSSASVTPFLYFLFCFLLSGRNILFCCYLTLLFSEGGKKTSVANLEGGKKKLVANHSAVVEGGKKMSVANHSAVVGGKKKRSVCVDIGFRLAGQTAVQKLQHCEFVFCFFEH